VSTSYPLSVLLLVAGGVANLASMSIGQTWCNCWRHRRTGAG
jgi:hypothetical protein